MVRLVLPLLAAMVLAAPVRAADSSCAGERAAALARGLGLPVPEVLPVAAGLLVRFTDAQGVAGVLWAGLVRAGGQPQAVSSLRVRADLDAAWRPLLARLVDAAGPILADADCAGAPSAPGDVASLTAGLDALFRPAYDGADDSSSLGADGHAVIAAVLAALALYALLLLRGLVRDLAADPRRVALLVGLVATAALLRVATAPRLPMTAAQSDFVHLDHALAWLDGPWVWSLGDYPPLVVALLTVLFRVFGASLALAFGLTTLVGAALAAAAFVLAERLGGSRRAGLAAGVVAAVLPLAAWFSNGVSLEIWSALFATASLAHVLGWAETRRATDLVAAALALVLFVHCRPEAFVQAAVLGPALLVLFARAGGLTRARPSLPAWAALLAASALAVPVLVAEVPYFLQSLSARPRSGAPWVVTVAAGIVAVAALWSRLRRLAARVPPAAWDALVVLGMLGAGAALAWSWFTDDMQVHDPSRPFVPVSWRLGMLRSLVGSTHVQTCFFGLDERAFPGLFAVAALASLLSSRASRDDGVERLGIPLCGGVVAGLVAVAMAFSVSGELLFQGLRYQVAALGVAAALAGVGFARLAERLQRLPVRAALLDVLVVSVAALPAVTHLDVTTNVWHDQQRQYVFVRDALARLPEQAVVLVSDHGLSAHGADTGNDRYQADQQGFDHIFRTRPFVRALARLAHRRVEVAGLSEWLATGRTTSWPVFLLRDLNCWRTDQPSGQDRLCQRARAAASSAPLAVVDLPARSYSGEPWHLARTPIVAPMLTLDLVRLTDAELTTLRAATAAEQASSAR